MTTTIRSGIPTTYRYTNFRSRLEARWAAFFDLIGWYWIYEPVDLAGYIPDFQIEGAYPFFVEVGPVMSPDEYIAKAAKWLAAEDDHSMLIVGTSPIGPGSAEARDIRIGPWLGEQAWGCEDGWGLLRRCSGMCCGPHAGPCGQVGVFHEQGSYQMFPCGHHDGDHHLGDPMSEREARAIWAEAGNTVQWQPR